MNKPLRGIFPALFTPFKENGDLDIDKIGPLVESLIAKGVSGFYVCGSSGEALLMTPDERKKVFEAVVEANAGRTTLILHAGAISTRVTSDLAVHAAKHGADVVSAVPPFYYKFSSSDVKKYYRDIADSTEPFGVPVLIYNYPGGTGFSFTAEDFVEFSHDPRFAGVKYTSGDFFMMERIRSLAPDFTVLNGFDEMLVSGLAMGAHGAIGTTYNADPGRFIEIRERFLRGDIDGARAVQSEINELISYMLAHSFMPLCKELCRELGRDAGVCRAPFSRPTSDEVAGAVKIAEKLGLM